MKSQTKNVWHLSIHYHTNRVKDLDHNSLITLQLHKCKTTQTATAHFYGKLRQNWKLMGLKTVTTVQFAAVRCD